MVLNFGGEGLVRINGEIISGIVAYDRDGALASINFNRMERSRVCVPEKYKPGDVLNIEIECSLNFQDFASVSTLRNGVNGSEQTVRSAFFALVDNELEDYWFDLSCAVQAMNTFNNPLGMLENSNVQ